MKKELEDLNKCIIKGYQEIIKHYKILIIFGNLIWFWLGYFYGMNNFFLTALIVWDLILILYIVGEINS